MHMWFFRFQYECKGSASRKLSICEKCTSTKGRPGYRTERLTLDLDEDCRWNNNNEDDNGPWLGWNDDDDVHACEP